MQATTAPMDQDMVRLSPVAKIKSIATCCSSCSNSTNSGTVLFWLSMAAVVSTFFMISCVLPMLGFVPTGIKRGSYAAQWQSRIATRNGDGSIFSLLQKLAMGGVAKWALILGLLGAITFSVGFTGPIKNAFQFRHGPATAAPMDQDMVPSSAFEQFKSIVTCWSSCSSTIYNSETTLFWYNLITVVFTLFVVRCVLPMLGFVPTGIKRGSYAAKWQSSITRNNRGQVEAGSLFSLLHKLAMGGVAMWAFILGSLGAVTLAVGATNHWVTSGAFFMVPISYFIVRGAHRNRTAGAPMVD